MGVSTSWLHTRLLAAPPAGETAHLRLGESLHCSRCLWLEKRGHVIMAAAAQRLALFAAATAASAVTAHIQHDDAVNL